jgi:hypothetical protein
VTTRGRAGPEDEPRRALARLREAGRALRARSAAQVLEALGAVLEEWRSAGSAPRRALAEGLPAAAGFTRPVVERGLAVALEGWPAPALAALYERELGPGAGPGAGARLARGFDVTAVLLAGAIPNASLPGLLAPLALRSAVLARPPARDPLTAPLLRDSLARADGALGAAFEVARFDARSDAALDGFLAADCVVATGSDETVARVAVRVTPPRRFVAYGHRLSLAALGPEAASGAALDDACARLALDVALWDQLGCLSPVCLLVAGDGRAAQRAAEALAAALQRIEGELPRGEVGAEAAAAISGERAEAELRAAARGRAVLHCGPAWTVVAEEDAAPRPAPLHRFLRVQPAGDLAGVVAALAPYGPHLAAVGIAGFGAAGAELARGAAAIGASRVCPLGSLQAPPLGWCHDGQGVLLPLARLTDLEA